MIYCKHIRIYSGRAIDARIPKSAGEQYVTIDKNKQVNPTQLSLRTAETIFTAK